MWDVIVVGAGPAGATSARVAAEAGASVLLLDKASFPRYKTCGGGLLGSSIAYLPESVVGTSERDISGIVFSRSLGKTHLRRSKIPSLKMVQRERFDQANVDAAVAAGAEFRDGINVRGVELQPDGSVDLTTSHGPFAARTVIGADGAGGRIGRFVGAVMGGVDLGLESEIPTPTDYPDAVVSLDWGKRAGTYAWVFPKEGSLTVGVIERKGHAEDTRSYLNAWTERLGLDPETSTNESGHLTQWRTPDSPLRKGSVILAGETAGLLEPWTREGISFALRSGTWAGAAAAAAAAGEPDALDRYVDRVERQLEPEIAAGRLFLNFFSKRPQFVHLATAHSQAGAAFLFRFCRGEVTLDRVLKKPFVARIVRRMSA